MSRTRRRTRKHRVLDKIRDELKEPHRAAPPNKRRAAPAGGGISSELADTTRSGSKVKIRLQSGYQTSATTKMSSEGHGQLRRAPNIGLVRKMMAENFN